MRLDDSTRTEILLDSVITSFDPSGTWHPCAWLGLPTESSGRWTARAATEGLFAGPNAPTGVPATVLASGKHRTQIRVTQGQRVLTFDSEPIYVSV